MLCQTTTLQVILLGPTYTGTWCNPNFLYVHYSFSFLGQCILSACDTEQVECTRVYIQYCIEESILKYRKPLALPSTVNPYCGFCTPDV
jgi:hypothetical protein